jgi:hypothetical protein
MIIIKPTKIIISNYKFRRVKRTGAMCGVNNKTIKVYFTVFYHL